MILGLLESALYVEDVERAARFYEDLFELERMVGDRRFCALNVAGRQVLLLFERGSAAHPTTTPAGVIPPHDGRGTLHLAFSIDAGELDPWRSRLELRGIAIESTVHWPRGGTSVYFRDPDQHLVELVTPGCWKIW